MAPVPSLKLNDGNDIPIFGLGTWKSKPGEVTQAVKDAVVMGYRHLDCAFVYQNEKEVGTALKELFSSGVVKREDLFITSKLWCTFNHPDLVEGALKTTLSNMGLDYLDLYLIHWPQSLKEGKDLFPEVNDKLQYSDADYVDTWKAMEAVQKKGLSKSIGISNFNKKQIERILAVATVIPACNQIECHPYLNQRKLIDFCRSKNIVVVGYSPLGSPDRPWAQPGDPQLLEDPKLKDLAKKYNKTPAQILLRYQVDREVVVIPKSVTKSRIAENFDIFDFRLTDEEIKYIDTLNRSDGRLCPMTRAIDHPHYPFGNDEYDY